MKIKNFSFLILATFSILVAIASCESAMSTSDKNVTAIYNISPTIQLGQYNATEQANIMLVKQAYADFSMGDIPSLLNEFADNAEWVQPGPKVAIGGIYYGKPQIAGFFRNLSANIEFTQFNITNYIAEENTVVVIGSYQARVKSTGRTYSSDFVSKFTVDSGKITRYETYHDTAKIVSAYTPQNISAMNKTTIGNLTEEENAQKVRQEYMFFSKGDLPSFLNAMAEDVEWVEAGAPYVPYAGDYRGLGQVKEYFKKLNESMEFTKLNTSEFIPNGNKVIVFGSYSARSKTTGQPYMTDFVMIWTLQDGKIVKVQAIDDTAEEATAFTQVPPLTSQTFRT